MTEPKMCKYVCEKCEAPVTLEGDVIRRTCGHDDSGVLGRMEAILYGKSAFCGKGPSQRAGH